MLKKNYEEGQINAGLASVSVSRLNVMINSGLADGIPWLIQG